MEIWRMNPKNYKILDEYRALIIGSEDEYHLIEFDDHDGSVVEAKMLESMFEGFPYVVEDGTMFLIVWYLFNGVVSVAACPVAKYWSLI